MTYTGPISIVCVLFDGRTVQNHSMDIYSPEWVNKLYRGFRRNLTRPMRFVCITDMKGEWEPDIERVPFVTENRDYFSILEAFRPELDLGRILLTGLDTMITGSMEEICGFDGDYGLINNTLLPTAPSVWHKFIHRVRMANAITMYTPEIGEQLWETYIGKTHKHWNTTTVMPAHTAGSEMVFMYEQAPVPPVALDDLFPNQIASFKFVVGPRGHLLDERLVYFQGTTKPHLRTDHPVVKEHWI